MFACGSLFGVGEGEPFIFLLFEVLFGDVFVDVESQFGGFGFELCQIGLDSFVELFGQGPKGLLGLGVEVVVAFALLVVVDLKGGDEFVYLFCVHLQAIIITLIYLYYF